MQKIIFTIIMLLAFSTMASTNEISAQVLLQVNKGSLQISRIPDSKTIQMAGTRMNTQVIEATITNTPLSKGSINNLGWCYVRCLSTNNSVCGSVMSTNGAFTTNFLLKAGEFSLTRLFQTLSITNLYVSTTGGVADVEITLIED